MAEAIIDWNSSSSHILLNPRMPSAERRMLEESIATAPPLPAHIWLATSGSSGSFKCVALSKKAILESAKAVNQHLECHSQDIWLNALPLFHVGGLGIIARSFLSGARWISYSAAEGRWDHMSFVAGLEASKATLSALVPAQIFDLVSNKIKSPSHLRGVIVGGGTLTEQVYLEGLALGWKLLPSYGLTECASQVATAKLGSWETSEYPLLAPLSHVKLENDAEGYLKIKSSALLSTYIYLKEGKFVAVDPKVDGWLTTEDKVLIENGRIKQIRRDANFIKIGGESVDMLRLEKNLDEIRLAMGISCDMTLYAQPDARLGHVIHLAIADRKSVRWQSLIDGFNQGVLPFERIRQVRYVESIPRSPLKKVLAKELTKI